MRYYKLEFIDPKTNASPASLPPIYSTFESHPNNLYNPACPEISFDCLITQGNVAQNPFHITLHNVPKEMLGKARDFNSLNVNLYAGFKSGLPLANPDQAGLIVSGTVQGCFGNWAGTNLTMDFLVNPLQYSGSPYLNLSAQVYSTTAQPYTFKWDPNAGNTFIQALTQFFSNNFGYTCQGTLDANNEWNLNQMPPFKIIFTTFDRFCKELQTVTQSQNAPNKEAPDNKANKSLVGNFQPYFGVLLSMSMTSGTIYAWDGTAPATSELSLKVQEFIGQPTWISASGVIQSMHPMRSDIHVTQSIAYPKNISIIVPAQFTTASQYAYFNGENLELYVQKVRHVGRYRDPNPNAWVTYIDASGGIRNNPKNNINPSVEVGTIQVIN